MFDLVVLKPQGDMVGGTIAYIRLNSWMSFKGLPGKAIMTPICVTPDEVEREVDQFIKELRKLRTSVRRAFFEKKDHRRGRQSEFQAKRDGHD